MSHTEIHLPPRDAATLIDEADYVVIKVGSALITESPEFSMGGLAADIRERPWFSVLVSSGAVAVGHERVPGLDPDQTDDRHALSAIGQATLITRWQSAFDAHNKVAAQVLLTPDVTDDRSRYLNARAAIRALFAHNVIPIVNENDAVTTRTFRYGDNDRLAAQTAGLIGADVLVILSDIDGLYTANPTADPDAKHVPFVPYGEASKYLGVAEDTGEGVGTGGMRAKLAAARIAIDWGVTTIIASGNRPHPIRDVVTGDARCTIFEAGDKISARKRWLSGVHERSGRVEIDRGAALALTREASSLLSVGVESVGVPFMRGEVIELRYKETPVGFGLAACDSSTIDRDSAHIVVRRDDLIVTTGEDDAL